MGVRLRYGHVYLVTLKGISTGQESTERFSGGGLIWPKLRFLNFFGHFGPLAPPMEGRVDFYHTNFSRRSHPRHPDFLPLRWMSKS